MEDSVATAGPEELPARALAPDRQQTMFGLFGGWTGAIILVGTLIAAGGLFLARGHLAALPHLGYGGVAIIAFLGNAPLIPVFPWMLLVAPMHSIYSTWGLVAVGAAGAAAGEVFPYVIGSHLHKAQRVPGWLSRLTSLPQWARYLAVFFISLSPAVSFPGLAAGVLRVPLWSMTLMKVATEGTKLWLVLEMARLASRLFI